VTNLEGHINTLASVDGEIEWVGFRGLKAADLHANAVFSEALVDELIVAVRIRRAVNDDAGLNVRECNGGCWNGGATRVVDGAKHRPGLKLCE